MGEQLEKAGYKAASLQGNLSQNRRQAALDGFRDGSYQILVATDIAARGIDVSSISHVINYDMPDTTDAYTHRIGRTGRAAKTGDALTFVSPDDEPIVRSIEQVLGARIERRKVAGFDYAKTAPARDAEFARPPRGHQQRSSPQGHRQAKAHAPASGSRTPHHAAPHAGTQHGRTSAPAGTGTRSFRPRSGKPRSPRTPH